MVIEGPHGLCADSTEHEGHELMNKKYSLHLRAFLTILLSFVSIAAAAQPIQNAELGFTFTVPPGYTSAIDRYAADPNTLYVFAKKNISGPSTLIVFERMGQRIGNMRITPAAAGANATLTALNWNGVEIDGREVPDEVNGVELSNLHAYVPLSSEGLHVTVAGAKTNEAELRRVEVAVLASITGETDRFDSLMPAAIARSVWYYPFGILAIQLAILIVGTVIWWKLRHRLRRGMSIIVPVLCLTFGTTPPARTREFNLVKDSIVLLGVTGVIVGVIGIVRPKRKVLAVASVDATPGANP